VIGETVLLGLAMLFPGSTVSIAPDRGNTAIVDAAALALPDVGFTAQGFQVLIERQLIIRIPARPSSLNNFSAADAATPPRRLPQRPIVWRETKAPKCVPMRSLLGIQGVQRDSIDLITRENERLRAKLNRGCRALDFYSGFYLKASKDGRLCADRDALHARSGAECEVEKFRLMVPVHDEG
jgi:hypothetical protein